MAKLTIYTPSTLGASELLRRAGQSDADKARAGRISQLVNEYLSKMTVPMSKSDREYYKGIIDGSITSEIIDGQGHNFTQDEKMALRIALHKFDTQKVLARNNELKFAGRDLAQGNLQRAQSANGVASVKGQVDKIKAEITATRVDTKMISALASATGIDDSQPLAFVMYAGFTGLLTQDKLDELFTVPPTRFNKQSGQNVPVSIVVKLVNNGVILPVYGQDGTETTDSINARALRYMSKIAMDNMQNGHNTQDAQDVEYTEQDAQDVGQGLSTI